VKDQRVYLAHILECVEKAKSEFAADIDCRPDAHVAGVGEKGSRDLSSGLESVSESTPAPAYWRAARWLCPAIRLGDQVQDARRLEFRL